MASGGGVRERGGGPLRANAKQHEEISALTFSSQGAKQLRTRLQHFQQVFTGNDPFLLRLFSRCKTRKHRETVRDLKKKNNNNQKNPQHGRDLRKKAPDRDGSVSRICQISAAQ